MLGGSTNLVGGYSSIIPNQASLGFGKNKSGQNEVDYTTFNLSSNGGFFVANGLMFGLNVGAFHNNSELREKRTEPQRDSVWTEKSTIFSITPTVRYYLNQGQKIQYFGEARGGIAIQKFNDEDANNNAVIGAKVGAALFLNKKVSLDLFMDFTGSFSEIKEGTVNTKIFDSIMGFGLAFDIFL